MIKIWYQPLLEHIYRKIYYIILKLMKFSLLMCVGYIFLALDAYILFLLLILDTHKADLGRKI